MVGSPYQTPENLADDMLFLQKLNPQMVGDRPFVPHHDTPVRGRPGGTVELTVYMLGLIRLLSATGAPSCDDRPSGPSRRTEGSRASWPAPMSSCRTCPPPGVREKYLLYDNKLCTGAEAAESLDRLKAQMEKIGYHITVSRGDSLNI